jgi:transposase
MARPQAFPVEEEVQGVQSILASEVSVAEAPRRVTPSRRSVEYWKRQFLEAGPSTRQQQEGEVTALTQALSEGAVELRVWKKFAEGRLCPSRTSR